MKKKKKSLFLTEWDKSVFNYLHQRKVALIEQIHRDLPRFKNIESARHRLYRLKSEGFLKACYSKDHPLKIALSITKKAFSDFINDDECIRKELGSGKVEHDIALVDVRKLITGSDRVMKYLSENELQSYESYYNGKEFGPFVNIHSDATAKVQFKERAYWIAIELEANKKTIRRYHDLLNAYYTYSAVPAVLFICGNNQILKLVQREEKRLYEKKGFKFYYKTFDDLKKDPSLTFTRQDGKRIKLNKDIK